MRILPTLPLTIRRRRCTIKNRRRRLPQAGLCRKRADRRRAARARVSLPTGLASGFGYACTSCIDTSSPSTSGPKVLQPLGGSAEVATDGEEHGESSQEPLQQLPTSARRVPRSLTKLLSRAATRLSCYTQNASVPAAEATSQARTTRRLRWKLSVTVKSKQPCSDPCESSLGASSLPQGA